ncbi:MAG TPA: c-type cytochrome [Terriglobales bacterium]|nr:c-type cytochrome [Terriglobales bacterium]
MRSRLTALFLAAALACDLGRSLWARTAHRDPDAALAPAATGAAAIEWPPGASLGEDVPLGERVYAQRCAVCHGSGGRGDGPAAPMLHPKPRDLTSAIFKFKSTPGRDAPWFSDVKRTLRRGLPGTSMPGWAGVLSDEEQDAVLEHLRSLGKIAAWTAEASPPVPAAAFATATAAEGKTLYSELGCPACHGAEGRGDGPSASQLRDVWKQPVEARDLTAPWAFRGGDRPEAVYLRLAHGISGTAMPAYLEVATPAQLASVVLYLQQIARPHPAKDAPAGRETAAFRDSVRRGEYLVRAGMCNLCHTPVDAAGVYQAQSHPLAGGMRIEPGAHGVFFAANLTSDEHTGLGRRSTGEIAAALRAGHGRERRLNYWAMPWMAFGSYSDEDALAIASYLKSLPPVRNAVPDPLFFGTIETVARKLGYRWPQVAPEQVTYSAGNFGRSDKPSDGVQQALLWSERLFLGLFVLSLLLRRSPTDSHGGGGLVRILIAVIVVATLALIERYPAVTPLPAGVVIGAFAEDIPAAGESAVAQHGRSLFAVSSCAFCHGGDGSGGNKVSWQGFGTTWSRNLTRHPTGLADWSEAEILRAITSGVGRDGQAMHWQAMPWDHFSNLELEDQYALLAFLRQLPPVSRALPPPSPPSQADCRDYTFFPTTDDAPTSCR